MPIFVDPSAALHKAHGAQTAEPLERLFDGILCQLHLWKAIALLVAATAQGVKRERIVVWSCFGLFDEYSQDSAVDSR